MPDNNTTSEQTGTSSGKPVVSLTRQSNYNSQEIKDAVVRLLAPLGGMEKFVKTGDRVMLKPNLVRACKPGVPAHTAPEVFRAVAELALDHGATVKAGDSPGIGSAAKVADNAGLTPVIKELGIELVEFTPRDTFSELRQFKKLTIAAELLDADVVINLPRLKTHGQMILTAAVKNLFGAVVGPRKFEWHYRAGENKDAFARMIYEICMAVKPELHILDAIVSMDGLGPTSGRANHTNFMAAGTDPVAIDSVMMKILGREPLDLYTIKAATEAGDTVWQNANITGEVIYNLRPAHWHWPKTSELAMVNTPLFESYPILKKWFRHIAAVFPKVIESKCKKCGACVNICPAKAITLKDKIEIDYEKCIRCYCCHELCPHDAFSTKGGWLSKFLKLFSRHM